MRRKRIKKFINGAINKLDKDDYEILYELYFNNTSIHQLSKKLGISRPAVRYRRSKALKQLKKIYLRDRSVLQGTDFSHKALKDR